MISGKRFVLRLPILLFALAAALVVTMISCGGGNSPSANSTFQPAGIPTTPSVSNVTPQNGFFGMTVGLFERGASFADRWPTVPVGTLGKVNGTQWSAI